MKEKITRLHDGWVSFNGGRTWQAPEPHPFSAGALRQRYGVPEPDVIEGYVSQDGKGTHVYECWAGRQGTCTPGCSCWCHPGRTVTGGHQDSPEPRGGAVLEDDGPQSALEAIQDARSAYKAFQDAWHDVSDIVFKENRLLWHRVDAYPGWNGTRDMGAGKDMLSWMDEVEESLIDAGVDED